jgi:hypothetical protein
MVAIYNMIKIDLLSCSRDAAAAVHGSVKPIFRRVDLLHESLVFMILRGEKSLLQEYTFMAKDPSQQATRTSMALLSTLMTDISLLARINSRHQLGVSPPSTPSRKLKSGV